MNESIKVEAFFHQDTATWSYVVYSEATRLCIIIDSVTDFDLSCGKAWYQSADEIIKFIRDNDLKTEWIIDTHIHADHLTGMKYMKSLLGGRTGIGSGVIKTLKTWSTVLEDPDIPINGAQFDHLFADNESVEVGDIKFTVLYTPGHTPCDVSYLIGDLIFTGDLMFLPDVGTGRCDFPGGNAEDAFRSIQKIFSMPDDFIIHVCHDYPPIGRKHDFAVTVKEQKMFNTSIAKCKDSLSYAAMRKKKDAALPFPRLLMPSIQFNLRAGSFEKAHTGMNYLKIPINRL